MCNAWNHPLRCHCGFGGEGHLGRRTFGNSYSPSVSTRSFFTLRPFTSVRAAKHFTSYISPNAHCPVCGEEVFFYQSEYGGRAFFDEIGYPWPKHPCTDSSLWHKSTHHIRFIGNETNQLALYFIHKWEDDGYFPLICKQTKWLNQLSGQFLYDNFQDGKKLPDHVWLYLKAPMRVEINALFFIKEINAANGLYELKFCYRQPNSNHTVTQAIEAVITNLYRPVMRNRRITFQDFTGHTQTPTTRRKAKVVKAPVKMISITTKGTTTQTNLAVKNKPKAVLTQPQNTVGAKASKKAQPEEVVCEFCGGKFPKYKFKKEHKRDCMHTLVPCDFCKRPIERHILKLHTQSQCRSKKEGVS